MATNPAWPYELQTWAYGKLEEIARDYREVPIELLLWCRAVVAEEFERPKQRRGRPGAQFAGRNRLIGDLIRWLRHRGETREAAIEQVATAARIEPERSRLSSVRRPNRIPKRSLDASGCFGNTWLCVGNAARPAKRTLRAWKRWRQPLASCRKRSGPSSAGVKKSSNYSPRFPVNFWHPPGRNELEES